VSLERLLSGDTVTVTPYSGEGAYGPVYGDPVEVDCRVTYERKLVRNAEGDETVSEMTLYILPTVGGTATVDLFQPESPVTHLGRQGRVIGVAPHRGMGLPVLVEVTTT
jgi:hypothetical protein